MLLTMTHACTSSVALSPPAVYCGEIPAIEHALVNDVTSFHLAGWVDYVCADGYHLSTDQKVTCQTNGMWDTDNGDVLECLRKYSTGHQDRCAGRCR